MIKFALTKIDVLQANREFHNKIASVHEQRNSYISRRACRRFYNDFLLKTILNSGVDIKDARVLEVGCCTASFTDLFFDLGVKEFVGVDLSDNMIALAQTKYKNNKHASFVAGDAEAFLEQMTKEGKTFDIIFSFSFLHHLYDVPLFITKLEPIIREGGVYVAMHEPHLAMDKLYFLSRVLDERIGYIMGYNTVESPFERFKGVLMLITRALGIKDWLKYRILRWGDPELDRKPFVHSVDYQFNDDKFNLATLYTLPLPQNLTRTINFYSYFIFPTIGKVFGQCVNHLSLTIVKTKNKQKPSR